MTRPGALAHGASSWAGRATVPALCNRCTTRSGLGIAASGRVLMKTVGAGLLMIALLNGCAFMAAPAALAAEYYLSPDGDDAAAGDRENPWQSIAKANE